MTRRPAVTLIEALVAIFIMAIGLLALLTLFPLGALNMAQALKDQRTAEAAINAVAQYKALNMGADSSVYGPTGNYFENPWPPVPPNGPVPPFGLPALAVNAAPTYPVYIDPLGAWATNSLMPPPVGGLTPGTQVNNLYPALGIQRANLNTVRFPKALVTKLFTLQDDLTYNPDGTADLSAGYVQREGRYTHAFMVRRAASGVTLSEVPLDVTVVVYSGRAPGLAVNSANGYVFPSGEYPYVNTVFSPGNNTATIIWDPAVDPKPPVRRGTYVLDARMQDNSGNPAPQGYFYRVVTATDLGPTPVNSKTQGIELSLQSPLGGPLRPLVANGPLIVMENVSEVFEKGTGY